MFGSTPGRFSRSSMYASRNERSCVVINKAVAKVAERLTPA